MKQKIITILLFLFFFHTADAQVLKLRTRRADAIGGKSFAKSISDSTLTLEQREKLFSGK